MGAARFASVEVRAGESDLWIGFDRGADREAKEIQKAAAAALGSARTDIEGWIEADPAFATALEPLPLNDEAPAIVEAMLRSAAAAGVGPMAAVAGAVAETVGRAVADRFGLTEIVVENGGDLWIRVAEPLTVSVYAGLSSLSETFGIVVPPELCPCGLATSSGTVGPSLSFGKADAAVVLAGNAALADAWATALGNMVKTRTDAEQAVGKAIAAADNRNGRPLGALVVISDLLAAAGSIRLAPLQKNRLPR